MTTDPQGVTVWFTGLSGAGKSTIAERLLAVLGERGINCELLDGDVVRTNLSKGLGFSKEDRDTNIRRIGFVSNLLTRNGVVSIVSAISPYREVRDEVRREIGRFIEVHVHASLDELVRRDVKGLYEKALKGEIPNFTGVSDPYEAPPSPEVLVNTEEETIEESLGKVLSALQERGFAPQGTATMTAIAPHGGALIHRLASPEEAQEIRARASALPRLGLSPRESADLDLIAVGAMSPLAGFMSRGDYERTVREMRLANGTLWSLPITLSAPWEAASGLERGDEAALHDPAGRLVGVITVDEVYPYDKRVEAQSVFGTQEEAHPGVASVYRQHDALIGGAVTAIEREDLEAALLSHRQDPAETRAAFAERGWRTIVGFQTRNPVHRAHEYIQKAALEIVDGLLLHPLVGETKPDDIPADIRMRCYGALLEGYYPSDRVHLSVLPAAMRYAGPREAVFHALVRKNYGCTHFIVGRDHAGVGSYYGTYEAQDLLRSLPPADLGITPLFFDHSFFCKRCEGMASMKTCPHGAEERVNLSGTQVRDMLAKGQVPPMEFTRPEVARILMEGTRT